jgi:hypothetical protein
VTNLEDEKTFVIILIQPVSRKAGSNRENSKMAVNCATRYSELWSLVLEHSLRNKPAALGVLILKW